MHVAPVDRRACGARASRAAASPAGARRGARGSGTSATRAPMTIEARSATASGAAAEQRLLDLEAAREVRATRRARGHEAAEVDDAPHARRARRGGEAARPRAARASAKPRRASPRRRLHRVDEEVRDVDAVERLGEAGAGHRVAADDRRSAAESVTRAGRARSRARACPARGEARHEVGADRPGRAGDENVHLRRTRGTHRASTQNVRKMRASSRCAGANSRDLRRFFRSRENLRHLRSCALQAVCGGALDARRSGWRGVSARRSCSAWRRFGLPRRRFRARTATSSATSSVRSISTNPARRSGPTIPTACARRGSCGSTSARSGARRPRGRSPPRRSRPRCTADRGPADGAMTWQAPDLRGRVAVVTGASRGVGRGIALALGDCGATVYVTGRSTRAQHTGGGTVDETPPSVTARGGARDRRHRRPHRRRRRSRRCSPASRRAGRPPRPPRRQRVGRLREHGRAAFTAPFWEQPIGALGRDVHRRPARAVRDGARRRAARWSRRRAGADRGHRRHRPRRPLPRQRPLRRRQGRLEPARRRPRARAAPARRRRGRRVPRLHPHRGRRAALRAAGRRAAARDALARVRRPRRRLASSPTRTATRLSGTGAQAADLRAAATASPTSTGGRSRPSRCPTIRWLSPLALRRPRDAPSTRCPGCRVSAVRDDRADDDERGEVEDPLAAGDALAEHEQRERHRRHALRPEPAP